MIVFRNVVRRLPALLALAALLLIGLRPAAASAPPAVSGAWVYLRDGQPLEAGEQTVTLAAVGDVTLARAVDPARAFQSSLPWLRSADLAFANLECALAVDASLPTPAPAAPGSRISLVAPAKALSSLKESGLDLVSLANNHSLDLGPAGLESMAQALQQSSIQPLGAGPAGAPDLQPVFRTVRGVKLAFLAYNAIASPSEEPGPASAVGWQPAGWDLPRAEAAVRQAAAQADAVIVSLHWGREYQLEPGLSQRQAAARLQAAGAALVLGHHPHVAQPLSILPADSGGSPALAAYSLGNFVFDQTFSPTRRGLALLAYFDAAGLRAVQAFPVQAGPQPVFIAPPEAGWLAALLPRQPAGLTCERQGKDETCTVAPAPAEPGSGLFTQGQADLDAGGQADLTGDGRLETVVRTPDGRLVVSTAGKTIWESPPEWQVADAALGDPEGDGRIDLALALYKLDAHGVLRSQPFLVGYRQGLFRPLWGGSPVADPILEIELGDIDGDRVQELLVLENDSGGLGRAVTVWRWHGWGFNLQWRSPYGRYEDLRFIPGQAGERPLLRYFSLQ